MRERLETVEEENNKLELRELRFELDERVGDDVTTKNWSCDNEMTRTRLWQKATTTPFFQNVVIYARMCKGLRRRKTVVKLKTDTISGSPAKSFIEIERESLRHRTQ